MRLLPVLLRRAIHRGRLTLTGPDGRRWTFGAGPDDAAPAVAIAIHDPAFDWRIAMNPELAAAEAYMDGALTVENDDVFGLLQLFFANRRRFDLTPGQILRATVMRRFRRFLSQNSLTKASRNAKAHYDIGDAVYRPMLDADMQYSCGYWPEGVTTLEEAQTAKKRHIAAKLALRPGMRVLDIGCGWGGMALYLAALAEVEVVGVTLAEDQLRIARARAEAAGLSDRVRFALRDYRHVTERFDRVVSVGMLEHVGVGNLPTYFLGVRDRLGPDGLALIHSITTKSPPGVTSPFIRKHIFPGGYSPAMSETLAAIEKSGLWTLDVEVWRVHYAHTLRAWRERFQAARDDLPPQYDARFQRMWVFYLASCEAVFRWGSSAVMQLQLGRERDAAPLSRDYIAAEEARLEQAERAVLPRLLASAEQAFAGAGA
jgi:cyclopropane-fatty-acyl-phospholipid synthase